MKSPRNCSDNVGICLLLLILASSSSSLFVSAAPKRRKDGNASSRNVSIFNKAAAKIDIFWIHPNTGELADSNTSGEGIVFGAMTGINSYVGHNFEIQEIPNPTTGQCKYTECRKGYFSCSDQENQVITIDADENGNFVISVDDDRGKAEREAKRVLESCQAHSSDETLDALAECLLHHTNAKMEATRDEIEYQKELRKELGAKLQEYTCDHGWDAVNVTTTRSLLNTTYPPDQKQVELLFESDYSSVRLYREFLTANECDAIRMAQSVAASESAVQKIRTIASMTLGTDPYGAGIKSIRVRVDGTAEGECALKDDGTCATDTSRSLLRVTETDETIQARFLVTCTGKDTVVGGVTYYPKAGVLIVPVSGEAVLTMYKDSKGRTEEKDPFVDSHVTCPVHKGVVLTLEDTYK